MVTQKPSVLLTARNCNLQLNRGNEFTRSSVSVKLSNNYKIKNDKIDTKTVDARIYWYCCSYCARVAKREKEGSGVVERKAGSVGVI